MVQLSHPYMTTGKAVAMTIWAFVSKVMSLFFNTLSRFVIAFLPRGKHLLISWPQSPSAVIWEPKKIVCHCFPFICHEVIGLDAWSAVSTNSKSECLSAVGRIHGRGTWDTEDLLWDLSITEFRYIQGLLYKGLSRVFSNSTVQKHQFFSIHPSLWSNSHIHTWLLEKL